MRYLVYILLSTQLIFANNQFLDEEQSVFSNNQEKVEQIQDKDILTYEQPSENSSNETSHFPVEEVLPEIQEEVSENSVESDVQADQTLPPEIQPQEQENSIESTDNSIVTDEEESISIFPENETDSFEEEVQLEEEIEVIDYFTKVEFENLNTSKSLYLSYIKYPKKIYKNQRFEVIVKALVTTDDFYKVETRFIHSKDMTVLNPENVWTLTDNNTFENTYYFKSFAQNFVMPTFQILLYKNDEIVEVEYLKPEEMTFTEIAKDDEKFSSIIAQDLRVNAYKTKQYNNNELITILDVSADKSNLEDFNLRYVEEQGFSKIEDRYPEQHMLYYLVMPIHKKKIEFNYYNTQTKRFQKISIPIVLENELISTQTDLNPNNSNLLFYKKVALSVLSIVFLILFIWKRKYTYLIILLIALIVLLLYLMPNKQAYVKAGSTIYILPTKNSTIFYKTKKANIIQVAMKKENFVKIIMNINNKKIIGWIKEDRVVEN